MRYDSEKNRILISDAELVSIARRGVAATHSDCATSKTAPRVVRALLGDAEDVLEGAVFLFGGKGDHALVGSKSRKGVQLILIGLDHGNALFDGLRDQHHDGAVAFSALHEKLVHRAVGLEQLANGVATDHGTALGILGDAFGRGLRALLAGAITLGSLPTGCLVLAGLVFLLLFLFHRSKTSFRLDVGQKTP